jgi:hypothetical protein
MSTQTSSNADSLRATKRLLAVETDARHQLLRPSTGDGSISHLSAKLLFELGLKDTRLVLKQPKKMESVIGVESN